MSIRESLYQEIADLIAALNSQIRVHNKMGRTDINFVAEDIYCNVLNIVWGRNLQSANQISAHLPAIDLVDDANRLAVQVTSNNSHIKIQNTLDKFFEAQMDLRYSRLIILVTGNRLQYKKHFLVKDGFDFDEYKDIWDESRLLGRVRTLGVERLKRLRDYLWENTSGFGLLKRINYNDDGTHELNGVFLDWNKTPEMIDEDYLLANTVYCDYEFIAQRNALAAVRFLFVMESSDERYRSPVKEGCFISQDNTWLLLVCMPADQVADIIRRCQNLTSLAIVHHNLEEIDLDYARELKKLEIIENRKPVRLVGGNLPASLECLHIRATQLADALELRNAIQLRELEMEGSKGFTIKLESLDWCRSLETLYLAYVEVRVIDLDRLSNLKKLELVGMVSEIHTNNCHMHLTALELHGGHIDSLTFLPKLTALESLHIWGTEVEGQGLDIPDISMCEKLMEISFVDTRIHTVGKLPTQMSVLRLERTQLSRIPDCVSRLENLEILDLSGLCLRELPMWLSGLNLPVRLSEKMWREGILMEGTSVEGVDMQTIPEQRELLKDWLEALHDARNQIQNEIKVIFLGDGEAGKSHIIRRLENDGARLENFNGDATPGISITNKTLDLTDRSVVLRIWDFGGQEILHAMHRIFMTKQTLYVVVLNARNDTQDHRAEHWLRFIYSFDKDARVILVLNKTDQNPRASINLNRLRRIYPGLPDPIKMSAKEDTPEDFTEHFINPLKQQLEGLAVLKTPFPKAWRRLKEEMESTGKRYIREDEYKRFCQKVGISKAETRKELLYKFVNLGVCFRCDEDIWSRTFLLLDPMWATNAIYRVLFNHHEKVFNGIISAERIMECLTDGEVSRSVNPTQHYNTDEVSYILQVMRSYGLSFDMDDEQENEFIPMLCDRNESEIMKTYAEDPAVLEVWWQFEYLPDNFLFHLMVELSGELDMGNVWLSGARFRDPYTQHCMVVERDGRTLKLYAENKPGQDFARRHMEAMERNIRAVIEARFPGLVEAKREESGKPAVNITGWERYPSIRRLVVHKLNGKKETFDLARLEDDPNCPQYSKLLKTTILAKDLLERTYRGMDPEQSVLIQDLVEACKAVQSNRNPYENPRNTYVRDILQGKDYVVRDQTLCSKSEGQNEAGQLDMEILRGAREKWTVFEGLNHNGYDYWKRHLFKLLVNYNPHALKMLFLVTYIENMSFSEITKKYSKLLKNDQLLKNNEYQESEESKKAKVPEGFQCIDASGEELTDIFVRDAQGVKLWRCNYLVGEFSMTVYHIFVHVEKSIEPPEKKVGKSSQKDASIDPIT